MYAARASRFARTVCKLVHAARPPEEPVSSDPATAPDADKLHCGGSTPRGAINPHATQIGLSFPHDSALDSGAHFVARAREGSSSLDLGPQHFLRPLFLTAKPVCVEGADT